MTTTVNSPIGLYPQTKLRIAATYHAGKVGDVLPGGLPESVEIEINEPLPGDALAFVDGLVASLFRHAAPGVTPQTFVFSNTETAEVQS